MKNDLQLQHTSAILHGKNSGSDESFVFHPERFVTCERLRPEGNFSHAILHSCVAIANHSSYHVMSQTVDYI